MPKLKEFFGAVLRFCFIVGLPIAVICAYGHFYPRAEDEDLREHKQEIHKEIPKEKKAHL